MDTTDIFSFLDYDTNQWPLGDMQIPAWDCPDLILMEEDSLQTASVVSEDIWDKFDFPLDTLLDCFSSTSRTSLEDTVEDTVEDPVKDPVKDTVEVMKNELTYDRLTCVPSREMLHHDCMWAGLCISKEHNRTLPARKDSQLHQKVPAGRSLLISRADTSAQATGSFQHHSFWQQSHLFSKHSTHFPIKSLDSEYDSIRPETPQYSDSETETEDDELVAFQHDQINLHETIVKTAPVSEVTGQLVRRFYDRRKEDESQLPNVRNTLSDHCYHLNQPVGKKLDNLGVQTPSESEEEEIDVVTYEKPCKSGSFSTTEGQHSHLNDSNNNQNQLEDDEYAVNAREKTPARRHQQQQNQQQIEQQIQQQRQRQQRQPQRQTQRQQPRRGQQQQRQPPQRAQQQRQQQQQQPILQQQQQSFSQQQIQQQFQQQQQAPRPRGRPPLNATRKRNAPPIENPAKRICQRTYQKRKMARNNIDSPSKSSSSEEDELDTEKRSLHNNMERQRRVELRIYFEDLRKLVPAVEPKEKAAKVTILKQAALYCENLSRSCINNKAEISDLSKQQSYLRSRLKYLRRSLALSR